MAVRIGSIELEKLTLVEVRERARLSHYSVPGFAGDFVQTFGRPSVEVLLNGIFFGPEALDNLGALRALQQGREPVDFFADAVGEGYFTQVLISRLDLRQRAGRPDEYDFVCEVVEYVEPPEPALTDMALGLDTGLLEEAGAFMDDVQNAIEQVSALTDLIANMPSFGDPTSKLAELPVEYVGEVTEVVGTLSKLKDLF
jgi:ABC-type amino acid transport substrate-binding protein